MLLTFIHQDIPMINIDKLPSYSNSPCVMRSWDKAATVPFEYLRSYHILYSCWRRLPWFIQVRNRSRTLPVSAPQRTKPLEKAALRHPVTLCTTMSHTVLLCAPPPLRIGGEYCNIVKLNVMRLKQGLIVFLQSDLWRVFIQCNSTQIWK